MSENYEPALDGINLAKLEALGWQIALCPICGMSGAAFKPDSRIATLAADIARLTAELERKQRECEGLRGQLMEARMMVADSVDPKVCNDPFVANQAWGRAQRLLALWAEEEAVMSAGEKDGNA